ncbi:MAG: hypothetical protein JSS34_02200 [Proteobacteria bacterium]|nr:hypothetical protein [Pseudomonadota bacterium]
MTNSFLMEVHQGNYAPEPGVYQSKHKSSTIIVHNNHTISGTWKDHARKLITFRGSQLPTGGGYTIINECPSNGCEPDDKQTQILQLQETSSGFILSAKGENWSQEFTGI